MGKSSTKFKERKTNLYTNKFSLGSLLCSTNRYTSIILSNEMNIEKLNFLYILPE